MSGLAAVRAPIGAPDIQALERMLQASPHRGSRVRTLVHGATALGVVDDPVLLETSLARADDLAVVFCGVLDNEAELTRALSPTGGSESQVDTATLVAAGFRVHGPATLAGKLRGTYTIAISDGRTLWCLRDHIGYRPLFYAESRGALWAATEISQVLAGSRLPLHADRQVLQRTFYDDEVAETATAVVGVQRLPKASLLRAGDTGTALVGYWDPAPLLESWRPSPAELQERFDVLMTQAVTRCLNGDDVVSLSGGVDSPIVAGYAAPVHERLRGRPLPALSIVAPDLPAVDESPYIDAVRAHLGLPGHTYEQRVPAVAGLDRWVALNSGPVPTVSMNELEEHYSRARSLGFRTILTGEFAEFLVDRPEGLLPHLLVRGRFRALASHVRRQRSRGRPVARIAQELATVVVSRGLVQRRQGRLDRRGWTRPAWLDEAYLQPGWDRHTFAPRNRWRLNHLHPFVGPGLSLEATEICQTICGVRVRRPWLDVDLLEFFLWLPAEEKYRDGRRKSVIRDLARGRVPDVILDRRDKTVFNDSIQARMDYGELKRWLINPGDRLDGVDYELLATRLEDRALGLIDYRWARDLAAAHAFLAMCDG